MTDTLGKLVTVDPRTIWPHEALNFTPWLARAENICQLSSELGLGDVVVEATEKDVGRFSADIIARDEGGALVLIENQLEPTDHRHLGQVLTYLAGLEGEATVVWIATRFLEEHRAAVDWLNAHTGDAFDFFGVEIEVLQIGESARAPRFNVVAKPNNWSRGVRSIARQAGTLASTDRQKTLLSYWTEFAAHVSSNSERFRPRKPDTEHWCSFPIGRSGFSLNVTVLVPSRRIGCELYISRANAKADFERLQEQRAALEAAFGGPLIWEALPGRKGSRISVTSLEADPADETDRERQFIWIMDNLSRFRDAFTEAVRELPDDGLASEELDDEG